MIIEAIFSKDLYPFFIIDQIFIQFNNTNHIINKFKKYKNIKIISKIISCNNDNDLVFNCNKISPKILCFNNSKFQKEKIRVQKKNRISIKISLDSYKYTCLHNNDNSICI